MKDEVTIDTTKGVLQDLADIVSLVRTITELFRSASDIYRDLKEKKGTSDKDKKHKHRKWLLGKEDSSSDSSNSSSDARQKKKKTKNTQLESDEEWIKASAAVVRAEYEHGYGHLGKRYAIGDLLAQNQLQAQIIVLQQTIIRVHQQRERLSPKDRVIQIIQTARSARAASTKALAGLYHRMLSEPEDHSRRIPGAFPTTPNELVVPVRRRPHHQDKPPSSKGLFCPYAAELQTDFYQPLAQPYLKGGNGCCPSCKHHIRNRPGKAWEIVMEDPRRRGQNKTFFLGNRFVVKCHREDGGFACVLCNRFRDSDTTCGEVEDLVDHIWREHGVKELEDEEDVREG